MRRNIDIVKYQSELMKRALAKMGKFIRENPPGELPDDIKMISLFIGGEERDPEGYEFLNYFLSEAKKDMDKEN